jgi:hypothetical protein
VADGGGRLSGLICCAEVIIKAPERRLPDARLLRPVAPEIDAVRCAVASHRAEVAGVHPFWRAGVHQTGTAAKSGQGLAAATSRLARNRSS